MNKGQVCYMIQKHRLFGRIINNPCDSPMRQNNSGNNNDYNIPNIVLNI